jgi:hypothetical protein
VNTHAVNDPNNLPNFKKDNSPAMDKTDLKIVFVEENPPFIKGRKERRGVTTPLRCPDI